MGSRAPRKGRRTGRVQRRLLRLALLAVAAGSLAPATALGQDDWHGTVTLTRDSDISYPTAVEPCYRASRVVKKATTTYRRATSQDPWHGTAIAGYDLTCLEQPQPVGICPFYNPVLSMSLKGTWGTPVPGAGAVSVSGTPGVGYAVSAFPAPGTGTFGMEGQLVGFCNQQAYIGAGSHALFGEGLGTGFDPTRPLAGSTALADNVVIMWA